MAKAKYKKNKHGAFETKIWDGTYNKDGSKHRKLIRSTKSSRDLEEKVKEFEREVEEGGTCQYTELTFKEYAKKWLAINKAGKSPNTVKAYEVRIRNSFALLEDVPLSAIKHSHIALLISGWQEHPQAGRHACVVLRGTLEMAYNDGYITEKNYSAICKGIKRPKINPKKKRPLIPAEKEALKMADFDDMERAFVTLIYSCGLRRGEALALTKFDFDFKKNTVTINKTWYDVEGKGEIKDSPKTSHGFRTIPLPMSIMAFMKDYIKNLDGTQLFTMIDGKLFDANYYISFWSKIVKKINENIPETERFGLSPLTAHMFRHNYCSELCYQVPKISIKKIAQLMGDTQEMVMKVYFHIMEEKEDASAIVSEAFSL